MKKAAIFLSIFLSVCFLMMSCADSSEKEKIVQPNDYTAYLNASIVEEATSTIQQAEQIKFWQQKLTNEPNSGLYKLKVATLLTENFKSTGDIKAIHTSDDLLIDALSNPLLKKSAYYHALSTNAITQHQFPKALEYANLGLTTNEAPQTSHLLRFDALMELGEIDKARTTLEKIERKAGFDYLIRQSKLQDAEGNLMGGIMTLEKTTEWFENYEDPKLYCWVMSNLGDMYGHAGMIKKSYQYYLDVLQVDPSYTYALKGIAWIAYSHDKDLKQAKKIINYLKTVQNAPDLDLFMAEMETYNGDEITAKTYLQRFEEQVTKPAYGQMYSSHLADLYLADKDTIEIAKQYAEKEIANRPTAQSYLLLARYYQEKGATQKAMKILENNVMGRTEEPDVLYHIGRIAQANGQTDIAKKYLTEAAEAAFELGPIVARDIELAINSL